jgi:GWxTD domain-containing protein
MALEPRYLKWLDEVTYIMTDKERDGFLALTDNTQRDRFIDIFWKVRDPTPGSETNEYKDEHYQRLEYVNKFLGRDTTRPGWKTDRGRIYILLGKPRSISRFPESMTTYTSELWSYASLSVPGVPPFLNLLFYKPNGIGEYKLYMPGMDSPLDLISGNSKMNTTETAVKLLGEVDPELAFASLSVRPGESGTIDPTQSSFDNIILNRIASIPSRTVDTSYVERIASGTASVELEYTFNFTPMSAVARAYVHPGAGLMIDYAMEILPQNLSVVQFENKLYTTFEVLGGVKDKQEHQVAAIDDSSEVHLSPEEFEKIRYRPVNLHGRAVAAPGALELNLLLKSEATKQYARADQKLEAEDPAKVSIWASEPLLCSKVEADAPTAPDAEKAFQFGSFRVVPRVSGAFQPSEKVWVYLQLYSQSLPRDTLLGDTLRFELLDPKAKDTPPVRSADLPLRSATAGQDGRVHAAQELDLDHVAPGSYQVLCTLLEPGGKPRLLRRTPLTVQAGQVGALPWILSRNLPAPRSSAMAVTRAQSSMAMEHPADAIAALESLPLESNPVAADLLLQAYSKSNKPQKVLDKFGPLIAPLLYSQTRLRYQEAMWCEAVVDAHMKLGHWQDALGFLERLTTDQKHRPDLLVKLSTCHRKLGHKAQADQILKQACTLDPALHECS